MNVRTSVGTIAVVALLLVALVLSAALTWEAVGAEQARRKAIESAIRGYAALFADDFARRTIYELEAVVSLPLRRAIVRQLVDRAAPLPSLELLRDDPVVGRAATLADHVFLLDERDGSVAPPLPAPLQAWVRTSLPAIVRARMTRDVSPTVRVALSDGDHYVLYGVALIDRGKIFGLTLPERSLGVIAQRAFGRRSAIPPVLGRGALTNRDVVVSMTRDGRPLFSTAGRFDASSGTTVRLSSAYGDALAGIDVHCSVAPAAVPALILGGMPASRVPLLVAVLVSSVGVVGAIFVVLRRERHLAEARSDFVSGVSHELRTPLTQIRMFSETLLFDRVRSDDERRHSLQVINEEAQRLTNLVDNVLFMSRHAKDVDALHARECDLAETIGDAVDAFTPLAMRRDVVVTTDLPPRLRAAIDAEAWKQVVTNLLDNAVKYGPAGQTVRVSVIAQNGTLRMNVDDEGLGIPAADRERVWDRFQRLERDRGTHRTGSGIGLAIVREIVRRHEGQCRIEDAPGGGARVVIELPHRR